MNLWCFGNHRQNSPLKMQSWHKNWLLMHNPVYPLLNSWFLNPHWSAGQAAAFAQKHYASFDGEGWRQFGSLILQYSFGEIEAVPMTFGIVALHSATRPRALS